METHRPGGLLALALAISLAQAACSEGPIDPTVRPPQVSAAGRTVDAPRYRDSSRPAVTGRSGSATLTARSVMGADGVVHLALASGGLHDPGSGRGEIAKAQVVILGPDGAALATLNFNHIGRGTTTLEIPGVPAVGSLRVQANVRGIDGRRTDVVTVTDGIRHSPALTVNLSAPPQAYVGQPTVLTALVRETNGSLGVHATCALQVNDRQVDASGSVWVDAGDAVTCAFTHVFEAPGEQHVAVIVEYHDGYRPERVSDSDTLTGVFLLQQARFSAWAEDVTTETIRRMEYTWAHPDGSRKEYGDGTADGVREQTILVHGTLGRPLVFPIALELNAYSGGGEWLAERWSGLSGAVDASGTACVTTGMPDGGDFHLCSAPSAGMTTFTYTRFGGSVTYRSWGYVRQWDASGTLTTNATWNDGYEAGAGRPQARTWSGDVTLRVRVSDAGGTFGADPVIPLAAFDETEETLPHACETEYPYWLDGNPLVRCRSEAVRRFGVRGSAGE